MEYWDEQPFARRYVDLLRETRPRLRAVDPHARVVLAGLPNRSWEALAAIYRAGGRGHFDVAAIHPFTATVPGVVTILRNARRVMRANGDRRKPLWATELSWTSARGKARWTYGNETSEDGQARRLSRAYALLARERRSLRLQRAYWYTWMSVETNPDYPFDYAGLIRAGANGAVALKPAFGAFRRTALALEGCTRKAPVADVCASERASAAAGLTHQQRHLEPLPVAVHVVEAGLAQPAELRLHVEQAVGRVLVLDRLADRGEESPVQALAGRGHVLEVGEQPARLEQLERLAVERALAVVLEMVDRHRRDHGVEAAERGQRLRPCRARPPPRARRPRSARGRRRA